MTVYPVGQGAWWSATGDQMSQDWCYLTFLFMIQLRELGTQSWNMQMLSNSEALQIQGNKREMRPMGRQREYEFPLGRPLRRSTNETLKRWSWRECPGGFFTQEDFFFFLTIYSKFIRPKAEYRNPSHKEYTRFGACKPHSESVQTNFIT